MPFMATYCNASVLLRGSTIILDFFEKGVPMKCLDRFLADQLRERPFLHAGIDDSHVLVELDPVELDVDPFVDFHDLLRSHRRTPWNVGQQSLGSLGIHIVEKSCRHRFRQPDAIFEDKESVFGGMHRRGIDCEHDRLAMPLPNPGCRFDIGGQVLVQPAAGLQPGAPDRVEKTACRVVIPTGRRLPRFEPEIHGDRLSLARSDLITPLVEGKTLLVIGGDNLTQRVNFIFLGEVRIISLLYTKKFVH